MFGRTRLEYECLERYGQNSNALTDKARFPVFGRIRLEFQSLEREG